jgi:LPXTG-site transpeptidase (sortase) family protein
MYGFVARKRSRSPFVPRALSAAMVALVLAAMLLPLSSPSGTTAKEDDDQPDVSLSGTRRIDIDVIPDPTPTPEIPIVLPDDIGGDEDPPDVAVPIDVDGDQSDDDQADDDPSPGVDVPIDIDVVPDPPVIDLPTCVDGDGDQIIHLPLGIYQLDDRRSLQAPNGLSSDDLQDSPAVAAQLGDLLGQPNAIIRLPEGIDFDLDGGVVIIPNCDEEPTDGSMVIIDKRDCPGGFNAENAGYLFLNASCPDKLDGVTFTVSDGGPTQVSRETGADGAGMAIFAGLDTGEYSVAEEVPAGYGTPRVFCAPGTGVDEEPEDGYLDAEVTGGNGIFQALNGNDVVWCHWFNIPGGGEDGDGGDVVIHKFECPTAPELSGYDEDTPDGCVPLPGIEFTLSYGVDTVLSAATSPDQATVEWHDLPAATLSISEQIPAGYGDPVVNCLSHVPDGGEGSVFNPNLSGSGFAYDLKEGEELYCVWVNIPYEDGSITVVKYVCAPGYDLYAQGANPEVDCPDEANGVPFTLNGPSADGVMADTGTSGPGRLTWGGLTPGDYRVTEQVPYGTDHVFVLSCQSERAKWIQGYPLVYGSQLEVPLLSGDDVVCFWYNVPYQPDAGTITVVKYACPTPTFVDADDCERYENGIDFMLSVRDGDGWLERAQGTTDGTGVLRFTDLEPGTYQLDEIGGKWCFASADRTDDEGYLVVETGEETTATVYNCGQKVVTKQPKTFPNTGVGQSAQTAPSANAPVAPAGTGASLDPTQWAGALDSRLIEPFLSAAKPAELRIAAIGVDARVQTLEVVDGALQDPTTADRVAWYKDTAKLGEDGNVVMAGHLNYWGVPEGVFYRLAGLERGDEIVVVAQDGTLYRYRVDWVKQADAFGGTDVATLVGPKKTPSLTLITCGGQWNAAAQEYDHRTVVRATLVEDEA